MILGLLGGACCARADLATKSAQIAKAQKPAILKRAGNLMFYPRFANPYRLELALEG